jgi:hypothetical protein
VVIGSYDIKKGTASAAFNGDHRGASPQLRKHARKFGISVGQRNACGTNNTVGRCAEWRAADKLIRSGSKIKYLRWTPARYVNKGDNGYAELGNILPPCGICQTTGLH